MLGLMLRPRNQVDIVNAIELGLCLNNWDLYIVLFFFEYFIILYKVGTFSSIYTFIRKNMHIFKNVSSNWFIKIPERYDLKFNIKVHLKPISKEFRKSFIISNLALNHSFMIGTLKMVL